MARKRNSKFVLFAVLACPWLLVAGTGVLTAISAMMEEFSGVSVGVVSLVSTLPGLTMMIAAVAAGFFAGKYGSYKMWLVVSGLIIAITGILPCFVKDIYVILIIRTLFGFAMGNITPVTNAVIFELYEGDNRTKVLGWHTASQYISAVVYTMGGGYLGRLGWQYTFLIYAFAIVPTVIAFIYLPNLRRRDNDDRKKQTLRNNKYVITSRGYLYLIITFLAFFFMFPLSLNTSFILTEAKIGDSVTTGVVLSSNTIAAAIAGLLFKTLFKRFNNYTIPISLLLCAIGVTVVAIGKSLGMILLGTVVSGLGFSLHNLSIIATGGEFVPGSSFSLFAGLIGAAGSLGSFCTSWYVSFLDNLGFKSARTPLAGSGIAFVAMMVIMIFLEMKFTRKANIQN